MIKNVAKISIANAEILKDREYREGSFFSPIEDADGNWIITLQEAQYLDRNDVHFSIIKLNKKTDEIPTNTITDL